MPRSTSASSASRSSWHTDPAPLRHHSITELLHDPRAAAAAPVLPPPPPAATPARAPHSINAFAEYLRAVDAPYRRFLSSRAAHTAPNPATAAAADPAVAARAAVPAPYFLPGYAVAASPDLAHLSLSDGPGDAASTSPAVSELRATLATRVALLEAAVHAALAENALAISAALADVEQLRAALRETRSAAEAARAAGEALAAAAAADAPATAALGERRDNAVRLRTALRRAARVRGAAEDAHLLVDAGEFPAAMRAVRVGRRALAKDGGVLERVKALEGSRRRLGSAVERIDEGLREHIRVLIAADLDSMTGDAGMGSGGHGVGGGGVADGRSVRELARLLARLGRSAMAHRAFLKEVRKSLEVQLAAVTEVDAAAAAARAHAKRAALVHGVFTVQAEEEEEDEGEGNAQRTKESGGGNVGKQVSFDRGNPEIDVLEEGDDEENDDEEDAVDAAEEEADPDAFSEQRREDCRRNRENLRELYDSILDMMCGVLDRLVGTLEPGESKYIVLLANDKVNEANFFDEAKGSLRFGEAMRTVGTLVGELANILGPSCCNGEDATGDSRSGHAKANTLRAKISERSLAYVNALGKAHSEALTNALQAEKWTEVRVSVGVLRLVACLTGDSLPAFDDAEWPNGTSITEKGGRRYASAVVVHDEAFKTVAAGLRYVRSICAFALFADKLPFASSEAARRGVELSRQFNTLSGRAILGAAALQWAGLRSITARHLALASRTVALAVSLAPHVGAPLQNAVNTSQVSVVGSLMQQTEKDFRDHHAQLLAKVMFIMMERLSVHEEALVALPWPKQLEMRRFDIPSAYIVTLAKEATVLHRILWSVLPSCEVVNIFTRVCASYGSHLDECYGALDHSHAWVRKRIIEDVAYLYEHLRLLDAVKMKDSVLAPIEELYARFHVQLLEAYARPSPYPSNTTAASPATPATPTASLLSLPPPSWSASSEIPNGFVPGKGSEGMASKERVVASTVPEPPLPLSVSASEVLSPALTPGKALLFATKGAATVPNGAVDNSPQEGGRRFLSLASSRPTTTAPNVPVKAGAGIVQDREVAIDRGNQTDNVGKDQTAPVAPLLPPSADAKSTYLAPDADDKPSATRASAISLQIPLAEAPATSCLEPSSLPSPSVLSSAPRPISSPIVQSLIDLPATSTGNNDLVGVARFAANPVPDATGMSKAPAHATNSDNLLDGIGAATLATPTTAPAVSALVSAVGVDDLLGDLETPVKHAGGRKALDASPIPAHAGAVENLLEAVESKSHANSNNESPPS